jgi:hypothetical protein
MHPPSINVNLTRTIGDVRAALAAASSSFPPLGAITSTVIRGMPAFREARTQLSCLCIFAKAFVLRSVQQISLAMASWS